MRNWTNDIADELLQFIKAYAAQHGFPPTIREMSAGCFMSRTNVIRYLDKLEATNRIQREPGIPRGIMILNDDESTSE
ncbi:MAG: hypothetical protein K8L99_03795 [Anaerolineae bacterium]|nr:hypothetical protein [Anaerolineae bacterium]